MPRPIALCIEELHDNGGGPRFHRCVALPGGEPGLTVSNQGELYWRGEAAHAFALWVSADDRLMLEREADASPLTLRRGARSLEVPAGKPVVVLDGDELELNERHLRVHVHGLAEVVADPAPLLERPSAHVARATAAAIALGVAVGVAPPDLPTGPDREIEVRQAPPGPMPTPRPDAGPKKPPPKKKPVKKDSPKK